NPLLRMVDLETVAAPLAARGIDLIVDSSLASPAVMRPLEHGATIVMHSLTKFISGHGDVTGGIVLGSKATMDRVRAAMIRSGTNLGPFDAWLATRGARTLSVRVERQSANALALARFLEAHPAVERVYYPGLDSHPRPPRRPRGPARATRAAGAGARGRAPGGGGRSPRDVRLHDGACRRAGHAPVHRDGAPRPGDGAGAALRHLRPGHGPCGRQHALRQHRVLAVAAGESESARRRPAGCGGDRLDVAGGGGAADRRQYRGEAPHAHPRLRGVAGPPGELHDRFPKRALAQRHPPAGRAIRRNPPGPAARIGRRHQGHRGLFDPGIRMADDQAAASITIGP